MRGRGWGRVFALGVRCWLRAGPRPQRDDPAPGRPRARPRGRVLGRVVAHSRRRCVVARDPAVHRLCLRDAERAYVDHARAPPGESGQLVSPAASETAYRVPHPTSPTQNRASSATRSRLASPSTWTTTPRSGRRSARCSRCSPSPARTCSARACDPTLPSRTFPCTMSAIVCRVHRSPVRPPCMAHETQLLGLSRRELCL